MDLENLITELISKGVTIQFHKENLIFTGEDNPMSKLMLQLIGAVAEFERSIINERRKEGVAIAKKKGVKFGRPTKLNSQQIDEAKQMIANGQDKKSVAAHFGITRTTLYDYLDPATRQARLDAKKRQK
jgi:DNA invertase Pin-like site-specific DNA recombinase